MKRHSLGVIPVRGPCGTAPTPSRRSSSSRIPTRPGWRRPASPFTAAPPSSNSAPGRIPVRHPRGDDLPATELQTLAELAASRRIALVRRPRRHASARSAHQSRSIVEESSFMAVRSRSACLSGRALELRAHEPQELLPPRGARGALIERIVGPADADLRLTRLPGVDENLDPANYRSLGNVTCCMGCRLRSGHAPIVIAAHWNRFHER